MLASAPSLWASEMKSVSFAVSASVLVRVNIDLPAASRVLVQSVSLPASAITPSPVASPMSFQFVADPPPPAVSHVRTPDPSVCNCSPESPSSGGSVYATSAASVGTLNDV